MRHVLKRAFAALLLLWFAVSTGEPAALHSCPVHDPRASAQARGTALGLDAQPGGALGHSHSHQVPQRDSEQRGCTCIGECSAGSSVTWLPGARVVLAVADVRQIRMELPPAESPAITAPAFLLPYANGPPSGGRVT